MLGVWEVEGGLEKGVQTPMAQGRSTKIISMIKWIGTNRLSMNNSPSRVYGVEVDRGLHTQGWRELS